MQWFAMIMKYFFGKKTSKAQSFKEIAIEIFHEISFRSKKMVTLTLTALGAVIFFCGGFFITLLELTSQYDRVGYVSWTATLFAGFGLIVLAAGVFATVFLRAWPAPGNYRPFTTPREEAAPPHSALESAFAALIMDFVKERELRREARGHSTSPPHSENPSRPQNTPPLH